MPAEYKTVLIHPESDADAILTGHAADGWTVKTAFSPTHFLLERVPPVPVQRAQPKPPQGARR